MNFMRILVSMLLLLSSTVAGFAQSEQSAKSATAGNSAVTALVSVKGIRFAAPASVGQMRLEVFNMSGDALYNSEFQAGNVQDWALEDKFGQRLTDGSYLFVVTLRDRSGRLSLKQGSVLVQGGLPGLILGDGEQSVAIEPEELLAMASDSNARPIPGMAQDGQSILFPDIPLQLSAAKRTFDAVNFRQGQPVQMSQTGREQFVINATGTGTQNFLSKWTDNAGALGNSIIFESSGGNIGIGTSSPEKKLDVRGGQIALDNSRFLYSRRTNGQYQEAFGIDSNNDMVFNRNSIVTGIDADAPKAASALIFGAGAGRFIDVRNSSNVTILRVQEVTGNVGIGTANPGAKLDVAGNIQVSGNAVINGNIAAKYQDVAEWVPANEKLEAGTVVSLDAARTNSVVASNRAYDTHIAGVVSVQPGVILGEGGEGKVMVATTGRVKVKVDATREAIRIGDLLVASDIKGMAMKSVPVKVGDTLMHRPGTIIGKALEPLAGGKGEILVLLSLQ